MEEKRAAKYYCALPLFYDDMSETSHHKKPCDFLRSHGGLLVINSSYLFLAKFLLVKLSFSYSESYIINYKDWWIVVLSY